MSIQSVVSNYDICHSITRNQFAMASKTKFALTNVCVFDGYSVREPSTVVIDGDKIGIESTDAVVIDCEFGFLLPGFIDSHVHCRRPENLHQFSIWGVTTAIDLGSWPREARESIKQKAIDENLTEIRSAGVIATVPGSSHSQIPGLPQEALISGPESIGHFIAGRVAEGAYLIKLIADGLESKQSLINSLVVAAHKHGKLTVAHATTASAYGAAQEANVDILTHSPLDMALGNEAISTAATKGTVVIPTLLMMDGLARAKRRQGLDYSYLCAKDTVSALHSAGVPIFVGTDSNSGPESPVAHGKSIHRELELLVDAGLSIVEALRAATIEPAKYFGMNDRGLVEPGRLADLVLISRSPVCDIRNTRTIKRVWCRGVEIKRPAV